MKTFNRILFFFMIFAVLSGCGKKDSIPQAEPVEKTYTKGPVKLTIRAEKDIINIAELLEVNLTVSAPQDTTVNEPEIEPPAQTAPDKDDSENEEPIVNDFEKYGQVTADTLLDDDNKPLTVWQYQLEPMRTGILTLPVFLIDFELPDSQTVYQIRTEEIEIKVASLIGDDPNDYKLAEISGPVALKRNILLIIIITAVSAALITLIIILAVKRARQKAINARLYRPAHEIALRKLMELEKQNLVSDDKVKQFYEKLSNILRRYIENRFRIKAPERTTEEFLSELKYTDLLSDDDKQSLENFLRHCDMVKFAKYNPGREQTEKSFVLARDFVERTKDHEVKVDVTEAERAGS